MFINMKQFKLKETYTKTVVFEEKITNGNADIML